MPHSYIPPQWAYTFSLSPFHQLYVLTFTFSHLADAFIQRDFSHLADAFIQRDFSHLADAFIQRDLQRLYNQQWNVSQVCSMDSANIVEYNTREVCIK